MTNPFLKLLPFLKQGAVKNPFSAIFQTRFNEMLSLSARQEIMKANRGWVFACVSAISQEVASIELRLNRKDDEGEPEEINEHPVIDLINKVNPRMTRHELFEITQAHQELEGNAFWFLARDRARVVREIWALRPDRVTFVPSKDNPLMIDTFVYRQKDGRKTMIEAKDIIHFAGFNAEADYPFPSRGLGTVQAAALAIDTNNFSREWNKNFFMNSARPDLIINSKTNVDDASFERMKREWNATFQGIEKSNKPYFMEGDFTIDVLTKTQKEMDFVKQLVASRDEILAIFRVPKTVLGITDDVNRANAEATNFVFALRTIKPKMQKIVDTLNEFLLPKFGDESLFFTFESPVPEDKEAKVKAFTAGIDKWLTRNEIRAELGLPPTENGDQIFAPFNVISIDRATEEKKSAEKPKEKKKETKKPETVKQAIRRSTKRHINDLFVKQTKSERKKAKRSAKKKAEAAKKRHNMTFAEIRDYGVLWIKGIAERREELAPIMEKFFDEQEERVAKALRDGLKGLKKAEFSLKQIGDILDDEFMEDELEAIIDLMTPEYRKYIEETGLLAAEQFGEGVEFDTEVADIADFIDERSEFFGKEINDTTFDDLLPRLEEGIQRGASIDEIITIAGDEVFGKRKSAGQVQRIVRTEVAAASNFGTQQFLKQAGIERKQWVNFDPPDPLVEACAPEPDIVPIDEPFSNGVDFPPFHPNCVCAIIAVFE